MNFSPITSSLGETLPADQGQVLGTIMISLYDQFSCKELVSGKCFSPFCAFQIIILSEKL